MAEKTIAQLSDEGGPAFPVRIGGYGSGGMSTRDYFAARAMQGMIQNDAPGLAGAIAAGKGMVALDHTARLSYAIADAMLRERDRR